MSGMFPVISFHVYVIELRITIVSVCHICLACPCLTVSLHTSGLVSVLPSCSDSSDQVPYEGPLETLQVFPLQATY